MAKFRKFKTEFAQVPNSLLQDGRLSFKARGLWAYLQSLPDDWDFAVERIAEDGQDGETSVRSGIKELEDAGYLSRKQTPVGSGGSETEYQLTIPSRESEIRAPGNRGLGNPPLDIGITNTQITNKEVSVETTAQAPGKPDINSLLVQIHDICEAQGWAYDKKDDRRFAHHVLTAKDFKAQAENCGLSPHEYAIAVLKASALLDFWRGKISGPASIYRNHAKVYNEAKEFKSKNVQTRHYKTL